MTCNSGQWTRGSGLLAAASRTWHGGGDRGERGGVLGRGERGDQEGCGEGGPGLSPHWAGHEHNVLGESHGNKDGYLCRERETFCCRSSQPRAGVTLLCWKTSKLYITQQRWEDSKMKFTVTIVQISKILTKNLGKIDLLVSRMNQKSRICASSGSVDSSRRITYDKYRDRKSLSQYIYFNISSTSD